jgi:hypothetical protein
MIFLLLSWHHAFLIADIEEADSKEGRSGFILLNCRT